MEEVTTIEKQGWSKKGDLEIGLSSFLGFLTTVIKIFPGGYFCRKEIQ